jgi:hypothetical protein
MKKREEEKEEKMDYKQPSLTRKSINFVDKNK